MISGNASFNNPGISFQMKGSIKQDAR